MRAQSEGRIGAPRTATLGAHQPVLDEAAARLPGLVLRPGLRRRLARGLGPKVIDQLRSWLRPIASVSAAVLGGRARGGDADDSFVVRLRTVSGVEGVVQQSATSQAGAGLTVIDGEGTVGIDRGVSWIADGDGRRALDVPTDLELAAIGGGQGDVTGLTRFEHGPVTSACARRFARASRVSCAQRCPWPRSSTGRRPCRVIDAIRASASHDGAVVRSGD